MAAACGGEAADVEAGQSGDAALPGVVAERLRWEPPRLPPSVAVDGEQMMVVGGIDLAGEGEGLEVAQEAYLVDLAAGDAQEIPAPRADLPVEVLGVTSGEDGFVAVGVRCAGGDAYPFDGRECLPGNGVAFAWDGGAGTWEEVPFPEQVSPARILVTIGTTPAGNVFVGARAGGREPREVAFHVLRLDGRAWVETATSDDVAVTSVCASDDAFYVLSNDAPSPAGPAPSEPTAFEGVPGPATVVLYEAPAGGGTLTPVGLPELDTAIEGASVTMACDRGGPYLTSSTPREGVDMQVFARRSGEWVEVSDGWGTAIATSFASAPDGVAVVVHEVGGEPGSRSVYTVAAGEASAQQVDDSYADRLLVTDHSQGGWLAVGPLATHSAFADAPSSEARQGALSVERLRP